MAKLKTNPHIVSFQSCSSSSCQLSNASNMIDVYQAVADIIRTTLGPRSMLKMLLDAAGG